MQRWHIYILAIAPLGPRGKLPPFRSDTYNDATGDTIIVTHTVIGFNSNCICATSSRHLMNASCIALFQSRIESVAFRSHAKLKRKLFYLFPHAETSAPIKQW